MKKLINWKLFFILLAACVITVLMVLPYSLSLTSAEVVITPLNILLIIAQNLVLFAFVIFFGLLLSGKVGLGLPILERALEGKKQPSPPQSSGAGVNSIDALKAILLPSIGLGAAAGVLIILLDLPFSKLSPDLQSLEQATPPAWAGLLASFYGGIAEEVLLRLFMVSLLVWLSFIIKKTKDGGPTDLGVWISIVLAAVIFGLGHLPATSQVISISGIVVLRAILLNGAGGIIFGWLYWKKGLESAIIAHFSTDIFLHVITPLIALLGNF